MPRINSIRLAWFLVLAAALTTLAVGTNVLGDDPCYGTVDGDTPCPSLGPTGTCEQQDADDPLAWIDCLPPSTMRYNSRTTGPYKCGADSKVETGGRCKVEKNKDGEIVTEKCGQKYICESTPSTLACVKGAKTGGAYYADKYILNPTACKTIEQ
jgi:hypothetical protein